MRQVRLWANADFLGGLFWLVLGAGVTWAGYDLDIGKLHAPGSGFMLFWLGLLMIGLASTIVAHAAVHDGPSIASLWSGTRWGKVVVVMTALLVYAFLFEPIGFIAGGLGLVLMLMLFVDPVNWKIAVPVSVLAVFGLWAALTKWLKIQLPAGVLGGWLG
jgi:putative tricarboxylic transport membrane protein